MAQDGARTLGARGAGLREVLGTFYPGTRLGQASGTLRVSVWDGGDAAVVRLPTGGTVSGPGAPPLEAAPGEAVRLTAEGGVLVATGSRPGPSPSPAADTRTTPSPGPPATLRSAGPLTVSPRSAGTTTVEATARAYRGVVRVLRDGPGLRLVNAVEVEDYLLGLGEVRDPSWPRASLQAQAVASRSYALASRAAGDGFDLWDDTRSQVYLGTDGEYAAQTRAVRATAGLVLTYAGAVVPAYFSTNGGGVTATGAEGFGAGDSPPWLRAAPYATDDVDPWRVSLPLARVGALLDYPGTVRVLSVSARGPSGRALSLVLDGTAGRRTVPGVRAQRALALRSTLFTVAVPAAAGSAGASAPAGPVPRAAPLRPAPPAQLPVGPLAPLVRPGGDTAGVVGPGGALPPAAAGTVVPAPTLPGGAVLTATTLVLAVLAGLLAVLGGGPGGRAAPLGLRRRV